MSAPPPVILYGYDTSVYAVKVKNLLLLKKVPYRQVEVSSIAPRPELSSHFGIAYRRIPVLAIGRDIYCDTSLIAEALEHRFPSGGSHPSIYPPRAEGGRVDHSLVKIFAKTYADTTLFMAGMGLIQWGSVPEVFRKDREQLMGAKIVPEEWEQRVPATLSALRSHLSILEEQLQDGRSWLFDTTEPSLADIATQVMIQWIQSGLTLGAQLFEDGAYSSVVSWTQRVQSYLDKRKDSATVTAINGDEAAKLLSALPDDSLQGVLFDAKEAEPLGLSKGIQVAVVDAHAPGDIPTVGKLVGLTLQEVVIETTGTSGASVRVHFPRLGFRITPQ